MLPGRYLTRPPFSSKANEAIPSTVGGAPCRRAWAPRRLHSKGVNWWLTSLIFRIFRPQIRIPAVLVCTQEIFWLILSESQVSPGSCEMHHIRRNTTSAAPPCHRWPCSRRRSMIAVTPMVAPPPGVQVRPVQLVDAWSDLFTDTAANLQNNR